MEWDVALELKNKRVQLPDRIVDGRSFTAKIDGQDVTATWDSRSGQLTIEVANGQTRTIRVKHMRREKFADEPETAITGDVDFGTARGVNRLQAKCQPFTPGAANSSGKAKSKTKTVRTPLTGKVIQVLAKDAAPIKAGDVIVVIEAMKMENKITAPVAGTLSGLKVKAGDAVTTGDTLGVITPE